jgi:hypothetical protein
MQIMALVVLCACLAIQCVNAATSPQQLEFSVYVHNKETKIVTGSIDALHANAYGTYNFNSSVAGWNYIDISANKSPTTSESHLENMYAMGFAEGYVSCQEIHTFWPNFYQDLFGDLLTPPGADAMLLYHRSTFLRAFALWNSYSFQAFILPHPPFTFLLNRCENPEIHQRSMGLDG